MVLCAETVKQCSGRSTLEIEATSDGASSRITWALVPLKPKELTPARLGRALGDHGLVSSATATGRFVHSMNGFGSLKFKCLGMASWCSDNTTLMKPATPAAASRWPILVLTEPISSGLFGSRPSPRTRPSARTSIGSPSEVPVPCAST